jgi:hypothetical protein
VRLHSDTRQKMEKRSEKKGKNRAQAQEREILVNLELGPLEKVHVAEWLSEAEQNNEIAGKCDYLVGNSNRHSKPFGLIT